MGPPVPDRNLQGPSGNQIPDIAGIPEEVEPYSRLDGETQRGPKQFLTGFLSVKSNFVDSKGSHPLRNIPMLCVDP